MVDKQVDMRAALDYEKIVAKSAPGERVLAHAIDGNKVFIKKSDSRKKRFWHVLQGAAYRITKNPLLAPSVLSGGDTDFEVARLREMKAAGLCVPDVLYVGKDFFVMSDTGENLQSYLHNNPHKAEQSIALAIKKLARMHNLGFVHGGAQIRNYTIKDGVISAIDFEEECKPQHIELFKIRDVLFFLLSLENRKLDSCAKKLCGIYQDFAGKDIFTPLSKMFKKYRWIGFLNRPFWYSIIGTDVKVFLSLMSKFQ